ncbi:MAG TPA: LytTR family DNA-binding domain-containing protein [Aquabacterium sp.]|nr:LytTR family DNA-binding domain-containing protein [Aquabacterium sp.]
MTHTTPAWTAVIADDEPWLRADLREQLGVYWPELTVVAEAADGLEAVEAARRLSCDVVFLDVQMPRMNGLDAAAQLKGSVEIVFLTAYDQHAVTAFAHRAVDYLLKPLEPDRLADTVARLRARLRERHQAANIAQQLESMAEALTRAIQPDPALTQRLQWIKAASGTSTHLIAVEDVMAFRAVPGYTEVVTADTEVLIRTPLRELLPQLDPAVFVQVHRNAIVNLRAVAIAKRLPDGRFAIELRNGRGMVETSRSRAGLFREE